MKIAGAFTHYHGPDFHRVGVKEQDYVPEAASLLHAKLANPLKQGEQLAEKLRKSKRKQLQSKTRGGALLQRHPAGEVGFTYVYWPPG